jgi:hypothetical protein
VSVAITNAQANINVDGMEVVTSGQRDRGGIYNLGSVSELELTGTSATTIVSVTPTAAGNFVLSTYVRVVTATTVFTLTASWTDQTGAQSISMVNNASLGVGSYVFDQYFINSAKADAITITGTAGTANQVYVSASIIQLS